MRLHPSDESQLGHSGGGQRKKEGIRVKRGKGIPTLPIISFCILAQSFFIFFSQKSVQDSPHNIEFDHIGNHLAREFQTIQSKPELDKKDPAPNHRQHINEFERHEDGIIATKIHGRNNLITLEQTLCLLHYAYNKRVLYNFVIFYTDDLDEKDMVQSRKIVYPANITFVKDSPPLQEVLISLPEERRQNLFTRCLEKNPNITLEEIDWWTYCPNRINYNWQAEFRAWHIWRNPALAKYKYMLWIDSDGFSTRPWHRDPMAYLINNNLVLFAARFGGGKFGREEEHHRRIFQSFQTTICEAYEEEGVPHVVSKLGGKECFDKKIVNVHGYFHLTNLDFYRSNIVANWAKNWIGDCYLCRNFDDQAAVTVPALILAPQKLWTMDAHNFSLGVFHNCEMDNKKVGGFLKLWKRGHGKLNITIDFPEARANCEIKAGA
ncbi:hypothetical protein ACHAXS_010000 [Conticribra weissflogii]